MDRRTGLPERISGRLLVAVACSFCLLATLQAQEPVPGAQRPRIGLVLAGGGAKGGAHVGVLKVMEELRIPVDCIAGTSMGALIGAGYASGQTAGQIEKFLLDVKWDSVLGTAGRRDLEPVSQKRRGDTYSNQMEFGLKDGRITMPGGLVDAARVDNLLRDYVARARLEADFDRLPIPFRAVATDMVTGSMVVLRSGDLATAMRASMAIPGAFAPVPLEQMVLADGGMVRNIPVDVARELCADVLIVSNLVEPAKTPEDLQSAVQLLQRSNGVMIFANETQQLATLVERDVLIESIMGDIGTSSFDRVPETIPLGEVAARKAEASLQRYSLSAEQYEAWRQRVTSNQDVQVRLADITFKGLRRVNPDYLRSVITMRPGDLVNTGDISEEALRLSALQDFDSVSYSIIGEGQDVTLQWEPHEKNWGPTFLTFDFGLYTSAGGDLAFVLGAQHTRTWLNQKGAQWRNEIQFGYETLLKSSYYQPLDVEQKWFVEPRILLQQTIEDLYQGGERLAKYHFRDMGAGFEFGRNVGSHTEVRAGYEFTHRTFNRDTGVQLLPDDSDSDRNDAGLMFSLTRDTRDRSFNATRGVGAVAEYMIADESFGGEREWQRGEAAFAMTIPTGRNLVWTTLSGGTDFGTELPFDRLFTLGGPGSFPGLELGEIRAGDYASLSASYLHKLTDLMSLQGQAIYAGLRLQASRVYDYNPLDETEADKSIFGGSLYFTGSTPVGPVTLGFGATTTDAWSIWLSVGRPVGHGTLLERSVFR